MHWTKTFMIAGALLISGVQAAGAFGLGSGLGSVKRYSDPKFIAHRGAALAPMGHVIFCSRQPVDCLSWGRPVEALTAAKTKELHRVNRQVNRMIRPVNDTGKAGWADTWTVSPRAGDCEDYALTKRDQLIRLGWSARGPAHCGCQDALRRRSCGTGCQDR